MIHLHEGETGRREPRLGMQISSTEPRFPISGQLILGRYRIEALLREGAAARIFRGYDLMLRRPVVLKVYPEGAGRLCRDESRLQQRKSLFDASAPPLEE